jgi:4-amino-4-deoxy-L-arabinose transferase-like glycosyltransferase
VSSNFLSSRSFLLALTLIAAIWIANAIWRPLAEPDEGRYAEIPREMLATGNWVIPHLNDIPYLEKPPLQYWATAALYGVLGVHSWVSRLWNLALGLVLIYAMWRVGRRILNESAGRLAALITASGLLYAAMGQINTLDMGLSCLMSGALLALLSWNRVDTQLRWLWLAWLLLGLAVLQKGLVGVVLPGFALALYVLIQRDWRLLAQLRLPLGLLVVLAVNVPWWWLAQSREPGFVNWFFVHEHFTRFTTTEHGRSQPWWYFPVLLVLGLLPWLVPTARGVLNGWRKGSATQGLAVERLLLIWAAAIFIFYAPSGSKLAPYILPMMPPLALLAGLTLSRGTDVEGASSQMRATAIIALFMGLALLVLPLIVPHLHPATDRVAGYVAIARWGTFAGIALCATALFAFFASTERAVTGLAFGMTLAVTLTSQGSRAIEDWRGADAVTVAARSVLSPAATFFCVDDYPQTVIFQLAHTCITVADHGELETQFDAAHAHHLDTLNDFITAWNRAPDAVAIVAAASWQQLQSGAFPANVRYSNSTAVVISKQP